MKIDFTCIENEAQIREHDLDGFASSFGHEVTRLYPIWIAHINGRLACYCHLHSHVLAYPAIHPDISPREFYCLAWSWFSKIKTEFGDPLVAVPDWDERLLSKIALKPFGKDLYSIRD